jgi:hypothetical protein
MGHNDSDDFSRPALRACFATANYAPLRELAPGVVAADVSLGPFLLALTPHSVLAAPYHRLSSGIVTAHRVLAVPPEQARDIARDANATYVLICGSRPPDGLAEPARSRSLWARLQAGTVPDWLELLKTGPVISVYRVVRP